MTTSLLSLAPRSVLTIELVARASGKQLYAGLAQYSTDQLEDELNGNNKLAIIGQHGPDDDRHEPYSYGDEKQQRCADSVAAIVPTCALAKLGADWTIARSAPCPADDTSLCEWERFSRQPRFSCDVNEVCAWSGSLIHERHLLTCWHGHEHIHLRPHVAVFGFFTNHDAYFQPRFLARDVVPIAELACGNGKPHSDAEDWAILRLQRPVRHRPALPVATMPASWWNGQSKVYTLGHPIDLPMKLTDSAWAAPHPTTSARFVAPLDTYGGCSGSPVIAQKKNGRHVVMGIVIKGQLKEPNFDRCDTSDCWHRHIYEYTFPDVLGQVCMRAEAFVECIKKIHQC